MNNFLYEFAFAEDGKGTKNSHEFLSNNFFELFILIVFLFKRFQIHHSHVNTSEVIILN